MAEVKMFYVIFDVDNHTKMFEVYDDTVLGDIISHILIDGVADNIQVQAMVYTEEE